VTAHFGRVALSVAAIEALSSNPTQTCCILRLAKNRSLYKSDQLGPRISTRRYNEGTLIDAEHDKRVSVRAIAKSAPEGERLIFLHGERIDVSDSAPFEMKGTPPFQEFKRRRAAATARG
jgi:hypothetical protein